MLQSEGVWILNLRLDPLAGRIPYKNEHTDFAGCPIAMRQAYSLCCDQRRLNAEPAIRLLGRKGVDTKTGTLTLQDARLLCDKRMAYAVVGGG